MFALKVAITLVLMGVIPILIRLVNASSLALGVARLSIGLLLTVLFFSKKIEFSKIGGKEFWSRGSKGKKRWLLPALGICFGVHWFTYFEAIRLSSASLAILGLSTYGIHVTWMSALMSERRATNRDWVGIGISVLGASLCLPSLHSERGVLVGFSLGLVSGLFYAALPHLHKQSANLTLPTRSTSQFFYAWLLFLPFAPSQNWSFSARDWWLILVLGTLCTFVAHNLWISITTFVKPTTSGHLYYLVLPITMVLETIVLDAAPSLLQWLGGVLIVGGNAYARQASG